MASNQPDPKRDEGGQKSAAPDGKSADAAKGTSSGGTPGAKLPNDKSPQGGSTGSTGGQK